MLGLSLHGWENTMVVFLIATGFFGLVAGASTWAVVRLQRTEISESERRLEEYKLDAGARIASADAAGKAAQADAEKAIANTAKANERAAELAQKTETLRKQNAELELSLAPRALEQHQFANDLKPFAGTTVYLSVVPDFEAVRFAEQLHSVFFGSGIITRTVRENPDRIRDGVEVQYVGGMIFPKTMEEFASGYRSFEFNPAGKAATQVLLDHFKRNSIEVQYFSLPHRAATATDTPAMDLVRPAIPLEALLIRIGIKPMTYLADRQMEERFRDSQFPARVYGNRISLPAPQQ